MGDAMADEREWQKQVSYSSHWDAHRLSMVALMHRKSEESCVISLLPLLCCCHTEGPLAT